MVRQFSELPAGPRAIAVAISDAVTAAQARDAAALSNAINELETLDPEQVGVVLGATVRALLEYTHADGLDSDDVQAIVDRCVLQTRSWLPVFDADIAVTLVAGALGVHGEEAVKDVARHGAVLAADLLATARRPLNDVLTRVFAEIQRAETMELP